MTEQQVLNQQQQNGEKEFYLILVGSFLHAYGNGAFALGRATGYRVIRKTRKSGAILTTGFPANRIESVRRSLSEQGGMLEQLDAKTWKFSGIDGTPDEGMVQQPAASSPKLQKSKPTSYSSSGDWLREALDKFDLSRSTPLEAIMFLGTLKQQLDEEHIAENVLGADKNANAPGIACESPAGYGLQE